MAGIGLEFGQELEGDIASLSVQLADLSAIMSTPVDDPDEGPPFYCLHRSQMGRCGDG